MARLCCQARRRVGCAVLDLERGAGRGRGSRRGLPGRGKPLELAGAGKTASMAAAALVARSARSSVRGARGPGAGEAGIDGVVFCRVTLPAHAVPRRVPGVWVVQLSDQTVDLVWLRRRGGGRRRERGGGLLRGDRLGRLPSTTPGTPAMPTEGPVEAMKFPPTPSHPLELLPPATAVQCSIDSRNEKAKLEEGGTRKTACNVPTAGLWHAARPATARAIVHTPLRPGCRPWQPASPHTRFLRPAATRQPGP